LGIPGKPFLSAWVGSSYAPYAGLVLLLVSASLFDTLMWPSNFILQGMARHQLLAGVAIASGLVNLAISIALVKPLGLTGVALGTLIPTTLECLFFVIPYSMRVVGIDLRTALKEIILPVIAPSILMGIILIVLQYLVNPVAVSILAGGYGHWVRRDYLGIGHWRNMLPIGA
jgi:O-antigen/teichoic acid export membrane protein